MKKLSIVFLTTVASLCLFSCSKENDGPALSKISFRVTAENPVDPNLTSASLNEADGSVSFTAGEQISVFDGVGNQPFQAASSGTTVTFNGSAASAAIYNVLSPYQDDATISGNVITATVPKVQTAVLGGVDPAALISVGRTTDTGDIHLKNVVGLMKVTVNTANTVKGIQIAAGANRNVAIAGTIDITTPASDADIPVYTLNPSAEKVTCVSLVPPAGDDFLAMGTYYIAVLNKTYEGGLTVGYVQADGTLRGRTGTKNAEMERSTILDLGALGDGYGAGYSLYSGSGNAIFPTGPDVLNIWKKMANPSVSAWSADDNVITRIEIKTNTLDGGVGTNSHTGASPHPVHAILRGGVLTLYTRANKIQLGGGEGAVNMFRSLKVLESVDMSNVAIGNTTTLKRLFRECTNLQEVDLSALDTKNVTTMDEMFYQCNNLKRVNLTGFNVSNVTNFYLMFLECRNLQEVKLGASFIPTATANVSRMWEGAAQQTSIDAAGDDAKKCQLYAAQDYYDSVKETLSTTGFNKARFFFHAVTD